MAERENLPIPENPDFNLEIGGLQPDDPVHFGQMNSILARLLTNEAFLEKLAGKMVEKALIAHVLDSANPSMVLGADQAPALTRLIDVERQRIGELYSDLAGKAEVDIVIVNQTPTNGAIVLNNTNFNKNTHRSFLFTPYYNDTVGRGITYDYCLQSTPSGINIYIRNGDGTNYTYLVQGCLIGIK